MPEPHLAPELEPFFARGTESRYALAPAQSAEVTAADAALTAELLLFGSGEELFGLPISAVVEICRAPPVTPVPRARHETLGIMSLRGLIVPVVDLAVVLGLATSPGAPVRNHRIVIVQPPAATVLQGAEAAAASAPVGLRVGRVTGVVRLPASDIAPRPYGHKTLRHELVAGLCLGPSGMIVVLDVDRLLDALAQL